MLTEEDINAIARSVASANLANGSVISAKSQPVVDSQGDSALNITIVLTPGATTSISGNAVIKTFSEILEHLQAAGESRFPIIEYATEDELIGVVD